MKEIEKLAEFALRASYEKISEEAREALKMRILDSLGCAVHALNADPIRKLRLHFRDLLVLRESEGVTLIGGLRAAPDRAAFYNGALIRYLDFNDSYLAPHETCHPSDNLGAVLAACQYADRGGKDLLTALAIAYQVHCRLSDVAPVRAKGFDHTTQGSFAAAAGVSKALGLNAKQTAHALAISGTALNALRVTRTGTLSHWKGLAYPHTAFCATHAAFLAKHGITGPLEVLEGNKGWKQTVAGDFEMDWDRENLERVQKTAIKKYNAEIHSQSAIEAILELKERYHFHGDDIQEINVEIFDVAYNIIGGGEEGDKTEVHTKEEADHSLNYLIAVALLDGQVLPEQYRPERIRSHDVQTLLKKVSVRPSETLSQQFPAHMPCRLQVRTKGNEEFHLEKASYEGFHDHPLSWQAATEKFVNLARDFCDADLAEEIIDCVATLDRHTVSRLTGLLDRAGSEAKYKMTAYR